MHGTHLGLAIGEALALLAGLGFACTADPLGRCLLFGYLPLRRSLLSGGLSLWRSLLFGCFLSFAHRNSSKLWFRYTQKFFFEYMSRKKVACRVSLLRIVRMMNRMHACIYVVMGVCACGFLLPASYEDTSLAVDQLFAHLAIRMICGA